jgi:ribosomal protein S18 acetylase RimI-like enzyme
MGVLYQEYIMSSLEIFCPASVHEAIAILEKSTMPVDSPTQRRYRTSDHLSTTFASGRRKPEWVWAARAADGTIVGHVAALSQSSQAPEILEHFGLPVDPEQARELMAHATIAARSLGVSEAGIFAPPSSTIADPALQPLVGPLCKAGWKLLVERRHYEFEPSPELGQGIETRLRMEQLHDPADPRLAAVHREVMRGTLDATDAADIKRLGFDAACNKILASMMKYDPVDCIRLAFDEAGEPVGMVSGIVFGSGRAYVWFVGVVAASRGKGYGRELLAWMTRHLIAQNATTLIADTDNANVPMAKAFSSVGWIQTETRIDLVPGP